MYKNTKQKFYQIPFGKLLNLLDSKSSMYGIKVEWIDERYTSKTSSISADMYEIQKFKSEIENKDIKLTPNELKGVRGVKQKKLTAEQRNELTAEQLYKISTSIGRGGFRDNKFGVVLNSDMNGACNHIKVYLKEKGNNMIQNLMQQNPKFLAKFCNPTKIKSNNKFDKFLLSNS
jgi:hypothetical protein